MPGSVLCYWDLEDAIWHYECDGTSCPNPFEDVFEGDYYCDPVLWAVNNGITNGLSENTFGPDAPLYPRPDRHLPLSRHGIIQEEPVIPTKRSAWRDLRTNFIAAENKTAQIPRLRSE